MESPRKRAADENRLPALMTSSQNYDCPIRISYSVNKVLHNHQRVEDQHLQHEGFLTTRQQERTMHLLAQSE